MRAHGRFREQKRASWCAAAVTVSDRGIPQLHHDQQPASVPGSRVDTKEKETLEENLYWVVFFNAISC